MVEKSRYSIINILLLCTWVLIGMGTIVLLVAAINKKKLQRCQAVDIHITGVENNYFIDKKDVSNILGRFSNNKLVGRPIESFNLAAMEYTLQKNVWIKHAEIYFDNNDVLKVNVVEREPVARIFCNNGSSFYIDTARLRLPVSDKFSARVPVFTNFPTENIVLSKEDSNLLTGIRKISEFILRDSFWMAQIEQVDITAERTFEMIPKIGQQVIIFGDADNYHQKFNNLLLFYKQVESKVGWNKYSKINIMYAGQVIGEKRGVLEIKADSIRTIQLMKILVANALKQANDTIHTVQLVQQSEDNFIPAPMIEDTVRVEKERPLIRPPSPVTNLKTDQVSKPGPNKIIANKMVPGIHQPNAGKKIKKTVQKEKPKQINTTNDY